MAISLLLEICCKQYYGYIETKPMYPRLTTLSFIHIGLHIKLLCSCYQNIPTRIFDIHIHLYNSINNELLTAIRLSGIYIPTIIITIIIHYTPPPLVDPNILFHTCSRYALSRTGRLWLLCTRCSSEDVELRCSSTSR